MGNGLLSYCRVTVKFMILPATTSAGSSANKTKFAAQSVGREIQLNIDVSSTVHDSDAIEQEEPVVFVDSSVRLVSNP